MIEAKDKHSVKEGIQQGLDYAAILDIPSVFSSNGDGFFDHDRTCSHGSIGREIPLSEFPTPEALWQRYKKYKGIASTEAERISSQDYFKISCCIQRIIVRNQPLRSWNANLYIIDRRNCLLFCHDETRYTVFLPGLRKAEVTELGRWFKEAFTASLFYMGMPDNQVRRASLSMGGVLFDTKTDRSVQDSLSQIRFMLDARVADVSNVMLLNPLSVTRWLCDYPVSIRGGKEFWMANKAMANRVAAL